jgi:predicted ATPase
VRLRDLARPERLYQLLHPGLRQDFPALRSLEATPNNLPQQVTSFVGHERGLADVRRLLGETRLLTLFGMGGLGKTRMSLQVAADVLDDYPDGVWFVELAAVADPRRVPEAVASVLGVMEEAGRPVIEALVRFVSDRQLLLILDNCEHLIDACAALAKTLLQAGPHIKLLASSREHLRVFGETTYAVPALALPDANSALMLDALQSSEAARLFAERAAAVQPGFRITADNAAAVAEICRRLDGIPLAIELAAVRVHALTVEVIAARLDDRFGLLTRGSREALPRQRTLRALIDWSYDLLSDAEKTLFARLSVFAGGMTLDAVEAVGAGTGIDASQVLDLLVALVEKSLVELDAGGERYRLLEIVRQYAQERLDAFGESAATRTRHLGFFLRFAEAAQPELWGPAQGRWLQRLDRDRDNFLAALGWCDHAENGAACGLRMVYALQLYWLPRGLIELGHRLTVEALERPAAQSRDLNRSGAQYAASQLGYFMGHYEAAQRHGEECLSIARQFGIKARAASALLLLGYASDALGQHVAARQQFEESAALARELGDKSRLSFALNALAGHHQEQNDLNTAERLFEEALALARERNDQECIGIHLSNLARLLVERGDAQRVRSLLREGLVIGCDIGSARAVQNVIEVAACLAVLREEWERAARFFGSVEAQLAQMAMKRTPEDHAVLVRRIATARDALGDAVFAAHEAAGRALSYDDAIEDVRAWLERTA